MRINRNVSSAIVIAVTTLCSSFAFGQTRFGSEGQFAVGAERLFGLNWETTTTESENAETTNSYTNFSLLVNPMSGYSTIYNAPRIAADYFVIDGLSLGGSLGYFSMSGHRKTQSGGISAESDTGSFSGFLFAPRVGYAFMFTDVIGIWPRGGVTFITASNEDEDGNDEASMSRWAFSLDAPLVITPLPHAGFLVGPALDFGFTGSNKNINNTGAGTVTVTNDAKTTGIALNAGMFLYF